MIFSKRVLLPVAKNVVKNPGPCFVMGACSVPDDSKCHQFCLKSKGIDAGKCAKNNADSTCCCNNIG